ncbi:MAG: zinc ribbon domain-containing protein [Clostridia bacterium]|nr:zinc ribbon domain-containing protein [Clostridia bacterium]
MSEDNVTRCSSCGAPLNVDMNRAFVFCQYCGCKNVIKSEQMHTSITVGGDVNIQAKTEIESMLASAEYLISTKNYQKANEMLNAAILSGYHEYRIYILKAKIDLQLSNDASMFFCLGRLRELEKVQSSEREVTRAVCELMKYRGMNGITVLHNATFHEHFDDVVYCVQHGSDVNCVAGMNQVTPITIMYVPLAAGTANLEGTPFVRDKARVEQIRQYLEEHGAGRIQKNFFCRHCGARLNGDYAFCTKCGGKLK